MWPPVAMGSPHSPPIACHPTLRCQHCRDHLRVVPAWPALATKVTVAACGRSPLAATMLHCQHCCRHHLRSVIPGPSSMVVLFLATSLTCFLQPTDPLCYWSLSVSSCFPSLASLHKLGYSAFVENATVPGMELTQHQLLNGLQLSHETGKINNRPLFNGSVQSKLEDLCILHLVGRNHSGMMISKSLHLMGHIQATKCLPQHHKRSAAYR